MTRVILAREALDDLAELIRSHNLPASTEARMWKSLEPLKLFPEVGPPVSESPSKIQRRFILGPWRWMILVYRYEPSIGRVEVIAIVDGRTSASPLAHR